MSFQYLTYTVCYYGTNDNKMGRCKNTIGDKNVQVGNVGNVSSEHRLSFTLIIY